MQKTPIGKNQDQPAVTLNLTTKLFKEFANLRQVIPRCIPCITLL